MARAHRTNRIIRRPCSRIVSIAAVAALVGGCAHLRGPEFVADGLPPLEPHERKAAIEALLSMNDWEVYQRESSDSAKADWMRRFWIEHDPTPTTPKNEFKEEHLRRVHHALFYFGQPFGARKPWDERGEVYVRYGEPDERRLGVDLYYDSDEMQGINSLRARRNLGGSGGGGFDVSEELDPSQLSVAPVDRREPALGIDFREQSAETWSYYRYGLDLQFQDVDGWGFYELVPFIDFDHVAEELGEFLQMKVTAIDRQPAIHLYEYGFNQIDYALDVARFRGAGKNWNVDVNLGYPLSKLALGPDSLRVSLRRTIVVRDENADEVVAETAILSRRVDPHRSGNRLMVEQKIYDLAPGKYTLAVHVEDLKGGRQGIYKKTFRLPEFVAREVQEISDIELAGYVWSMYEPGSPFIKGERMVMPLPSRVYLEGQPLAFYYEVYNLRLDDADSCRYAVSYEILDYTADERYYRAEPREFRGGSRDIVQYGSIDLGGIPSGEFLLAVIVDDKVGRHSKRSLTRFKKVTGN